MALKTGYKVNEKEIILDDYSNYSSDKTLREAVRTECCVTLSNYYKVRNEEIRASVLSNSDTYISNKGQIPAELPGDNYYKAPSGAQRFALYGTNTVGGWINGHASNKWKKFEGSADTTRPDRLISIKFDDARLTATENGVVNELRTYVLDDGTPLDLDTIKVWCYMVGAGGGQYLSDTPGGGGGGASAVFSLKIPRGETIQVKIPSCSSTGYSGGSTILSSLNNLFPKFEVKGGLHGESNTGGEGGVATSYTTNEYITWFQSKAGGGGGYNTTSAASVVFRTDTLYTDYFPLYKMVDNKGGYGKGTIPLAGYTVVSFSGGGASGFPDGTGGYIEERDLSGRIIEHKPGPGGGACSSYDGHIITGGPGAFWILVA